MQILESVPSEQVVLLWLQGELPSPRFGNNLRAALRSHMANENLILKPDIGNEAENKLRLQVLRDYRPWFTEDPSMVDWHRASLTIADILQLRYIDYSYWNKLSDNTHLVEKAAQNLRGGKAVFNVSNHGFWQVARLIDENRALPPLILRTSTDESSLEILEGHVRATAYALARYTPEAINTIVGFGINKHHSRNMPAIQ